MLLDSGTYADQASQIEGRGRKTHVDYWLLHLQGECVEISQLNKWNIDSIN